MLAVLSLSLCGAAEASQQSEMLYSQGLLRFHAEQFDAALTLFEQAVEADPNDVYALYYRGVTRGHLGDMDGAIRDLRTAVERKPDLSEAVLELGVALVDAGRSAEAIPWLEQAQKVPELEAQASFFLGIAQLRQGEEESAEANLERAAKADPTLEPATLYYRGVAAYQTARWQEAERRFRGVASASPGSKLSREAADFLAVIQARRGRSFQLYGDLALQYDSNVTIAPDDETLNDELGISDEDDGLVAVTAGANYSPLRTQGALLNLGYSFFQSFYFDLTDFNLQNHRPSVEVAGRAGDFRFGLLGRYDYYTLDVSSFLQEATAQPWLTLFHGAYSRLDVWYRMRYRDFLDSDFDLRSGFNHSAGSRHAFNLGDWTRFVAVAYRYDREDPDGSSQTAQAFGYDGHEVSASLGWTFPADVWADASYAFRRERYDAASDGRRDNEHQVIVGLGKELTDWLFVRCSYFGTFNDSNQNVFQYDRHIVSTSLEVQY
jgi:tetratricopeptide (TPR) repeat protein